MLGKIDLKVTHDGFRYIEPNEMYYPPGGGNMQMEHGFHVRTLTVYPVEDTAEGGLANGNLLIPDGLVLIDTSPNIPLTGKKLRITIEEIED